MGKKYFWVQKNVGQKNFGSKICWVIKILGKKIIWVKRCRSEIFLSKKNPVGLAQGGGYMTPPENSRVKIVVLFRQISVRDA